MADPRSDMSHVVGRIVQRRDEDDEIKHLAKAVVDLYQRLKELQEDVDRHGRRIEDVELR